jgi:Tfp pilus assembly ATPase PilU
MDIGYFLKLMTEKNASDMFLTTGAPVNIKVEGKLYPLGNTGAGGMVKKIAYSLMDETGSGFRARSESIWPSRSRMPTLASTRSSNAAK